MKIRIKTIKMREIKFRAWDKKNKKYFNECECLSFGLGGIRFMWTDYKNDEQMVTQLPTNDYILLQFTGLLDRKGKEIYEGDIIYYKGCTDEDKHCIEEVVFENCSFVGKTIGKSENKKTVNMIGNCEVIGNIYENSDLINNN